MWLPNHISTIKSITNINQFFIALALISARCKMKHNQALRLEFVNQNFLVALNGGKGILL